MKRLFNAIKQFFVARVVVNLNQQDIPLFIDKELKIDDERNKISDLKAEQIKDKVEDILKNVYVNYCIVFSIELYVGRISPSNVIKYFESVVKPTIPHSINRALELLQIDGYMVSSVLNPSKEDYCKYSIKVSI